MSSARIAVPAPEHACRYDGKSPPALVALRLMPVFMRRRARTGRIL